jgi:hypothetical protein
MTHAWLWFGLQAGASNSPNPACDMCVPAANAHAHLADCDELGWSIVVFG